MPYRMHLFGVSAIKDGTPPVRPWYSNWLRRNVLQLLERQKFAAERRRNQSIRPQARQYDDIFAIYPPALADLKRHSDSGTG